MLLAILALQLASFGVAAGALWVAVKAMENTEGVVDQNACTMRALVELLSAPAATSEAVEGSPPAPEGRPLH